MVMLERDAGRGFAGVERMALETTTTAYNGRHSLRGGASPEHCPALPHHAPSIPASPRTAQCPTLAVTQSHEF